MVLVVMGVVVLVLDFLAATGGKLFQQVLIKKIGELEEVGVQGAKFAIAIAADDSPEGEDADDKDSVSINANDIIKAILSKSDMSEEEAREKYDQVLSVLGEGVVLEEEENDQS